MEPFASALCGSPIAKVVGERPRAITSVKEVCAGPIHRIHRGDKAPAAAGVIHSDFEKGFIRAEVIKLTDYQLYRTEVKIKEAGKMAVEGKEYVVQDGDVMHFRFNV